MIIENAGTFGVTGIPVATYGRSFYREPVMPAKLTTHVLDTAHGCPAAGMKIELWALAAGARTLLTTACTNADGRPETPLLPADEMAAGQYELVFFVGDYFAARGTPQLRQRFLDQVPVRFGMADTSAAYHVPLLCSPWSYATYRGS